MHLPIKRREFLRQDAPMIRGFGDLVHLAAHPIARVIDKVAGTNLQNCGGCHKRREHWNEKLPIG